MLAASCTQDPGTPYDESDDEETPTDDPSRYHGLDQEDPYFEGWYFNVKDPYQARSHAFVLAVINPNQTSGEFSTAYVFVADMGRGEVVMELFPVDQLDASVRGLDVRIGEGISASGSRLEGSIEGDGMVVSWAIDLENWGRWDKTMGILTNVPDIAMNWDVNMLNGRASGWVEFDGERTDYASAAAYGDHNWGTSFPDDYIWGQANHFSDPGDCLAFSGGDVPLGDLTLKGYMIGYRRGAEFYEVRSQDGDLIRHTYQNGVWVLEGIEGDRKLVITGVADPAGMVMLPAPRPEGLVDYAGQTLSGTITVEIYGRDGLGWELLDSNTSSPAGLENGGGQP